jgi:prepilin-type N-terminal cleavage/methylation domain-containing protein
MRHSQKTAGGFTLIELVFALAVLATITGIALPVSTIAIDDLQTAAAARYVAGRVMNSRMDALKRARCVALRFEVSGGPDYAFGPVADGNGNGVRTTEIRSGVDVPLGPSERLSDKFAGVRFGLQSGIPDADGVRSASTDGVRIGSARILSTSPDGTATSGTLYLQGRRAQYAVRVLGATARTRVLKFDAGAGTWSSH